MRLYNLRRKWLLGLWLLEDTDINVGFLWYWQKNNLGHYIALSLILRSLSLSLASRAVSQGLSLSHSLSLVLSRTLTAREVSLPITLAIRSPKRTLEDHRVLRRCISSSLYLSVILASDFPIHGWSRPLVFVALSLIYWFWSLASRWSLIYWLWKVVIFFSCVLELLQIGSYVYI